MRWKRLGPFATDGGLPCPGQYQVEREPALREAEEAAQLAAEKRLWQAERLDPETRGSTPAESLERGASAGCTS